MQHVRPTRAPVVQRFGSARARDGATRRRQADLAQHLSLRRLSSATRSDDWLRSWEDAEDGRRGTWTFSFSRGVEGHESARSEDCQGRQRDESLHTEIPPAPGPGAGADSVNSVSEDLLLVYRSWRGVSGFGSTSRAQRGDLCDRVLIVRTPCAHIRAERRNLDVTICTAIGVWALGATASLYTKPYSRRSRAPLQPQRCTTLHINTVCVRRGPKVCWSDGSGRCAILYSRGLASKPASPRQC